jgi:signal recognition particle GTPase
VKRKELEDADHLKKALQEEMFLILRQQENPLNVSSANPFVIMVIGVNGTGKTTIARRLFQQYDDRPDCSVAYIPTPHYRSAFQFLKAICAEFGLPPKASRRIPVGFYHLSQL